MDLNADIGEGGLLDAALIAQLSSANLACGGHAGDETTMRESIRLCLAAGVAIGAHPGYEDKEHFGRRALALPPDEVTAMVARQVARIVEMTARAGASVHHVKPHGALYHQADRDPFLAAAVAEGVARVAPGCGFYVPPGAELAIAGKKAGLRVRGEGFMDRHYAGDGGLVPRGEAGAVITEVGEAVAQALEIACRQRVRTVTGTWFPMPAETLCVHGDTSGAVEILGAVRQAMVAAGCEIRA